jgi:hypothetical protein
MRAVRPLVTLVAAVVLLTAMSRFEDPRLTSRLDGRTREAVSAIIDAAVREGIPAEPLVDKALEGASKRAPGSAIVVAVRNWAADLKRARQALGPSSSDRDIQAGATALRAGIRPQELEQLRAAKSGVRVASALDVMTLLVTSGVPADTIGPVIVRLVVASVSEEQLTAFQLDVQRDIAGGVSALTAAAVRGRGLERQLAARGPGDGGGPGSTLPSVRGQQRAVDPLVNPQAVGSQGSANVSGAGDGARPAGPRGKPKPKRP